MMPLTESKKANWAYINKVGGTVAGYGLVFGLLSVIFGWIWGVFGFIIGSGVGYYLAKSRNDKEKNNTITLAERKTSKSIKSLMWFVAILLIIAVMAVNPGLRMLLSFVGAFCSFIAIIGAKGKHKLWALLLIFTSLVILSESYTESKKHYESYREHMLRKQDKNTIKNMSKMHLYFKL